MQPENLTPNAEGYYEWPGPSETIEVTGLAPVGFEDLVSAEKLKLVHVMDPEQIRKLRELEEPSRPSSSWRTTEESKQYWESMDEIDPGAWQSEWNEQESARIKKMDQAYMEYLNHKAFQLERSYSKMETLGKIGKGIGWGMLVGVTALGGGIGLTAVKPIPSLATTIANSPTAATVGAAAATAKQAIDKVLPTLLQEGETFLAVFKNGEMLARTRNTLLPHAEFVKRFLGTLSEGSEVITFGKYQGQIEALLSATFHGNRLPASAATLAALKKLFE
jgi:hypothetical protein